MTMQQGILQEDITKAKPISTLEKVALSQVNGLIKFDYNSVSYFFFCQRGKLIYATSSVAPFERVDRHLKRLSHKIPELNQNVRAQANQKFEEIKNDSPDDSPESLSEYLTISWLVEKGYINSQQTTILIKNIVQEVIESYLLIPPSTPYEVENHNQNIVPFNRFHLPSFIEECNQKLQEWKKFSSHIKSPYFRPYFLNTKSTNKGISVQQQEKLSKILRGFNFLQLAAILNQDELTIAQKFYPLIVNKFIVLRNPQVPFDRLPNFDTSSVKVVPGVSQDATPLKEKDIARDVNLSDVSDAHSPQKNYTIVCVDDSPIMLKSITEFLDNDNLSVVAEKNSAKALVTMAKVKPDLVLMDIGMPNIDGYQLCSLIRKHPSLKDIPVIMVTGNKGIINRAKAKLCGATDYMTKPFTQGDLLTIVFRYLT